MTNTQELIEALAKLRKTQVEAAKEFVTQPSGEVAVQVSSQPAETVTEVHGEEAVQTSSPEPTGLCSECGAPEDPSLPYGGLKRIGPDEDIQYLCQQHYAEYRERKRQSETFVVGRHLEQGEDEYDYDGELFTVLEVHDVQNDEGQIIFPDQYEYAPKPPILPVLFKLSSVDVFKRIIDGISTLVEEAEFKATTEGIIFRTMDPSHVSLVDLLIPKDNCEKWDFTGDERKFTFRVEDMQKILKRKHKKDSIQLFVDQEQMEITLENGRKRVFSLNLIEGYTPETPLPKLNFTTKIALVYEGLMDILKDVEITSDHVTIAATSERVVFSGKSDAGKSRTDLTKSDMHMVEMTVKEDEAKATFNIDYLTKILKAVPCSLVTIEYASKLPMRMELPLDEYGTRLYFFLAPRIEER